MPGVVGPPVAVEECLAFSWSEVDTSGVEGRDHVYLAPDVLAGGDRMKTFVVLGLWFVLLTAPRLSTAAGDDKERPPGQPVKLGRISDVKLAPRPAAGEAQVKRIKALIADLAKLDSADIGLSATVSGHSFAPVPGQSHVGT